MRVVAGVIELWIRRPLEISALLPKLQNWRGASSVATVLAVAGFALWMMKPVGDWLLTGVAYALVVVGSAIGALAKGLWLDYRLKLSFFVAVVVGAGGFALGFAKGFEGAPAELIFFSVLPLVWAFVVAGQGSYTVRWIVNAIPAATVAVSLIGVLYWAGRVSDSSAFDWFSVFGLGLGVWDQGYGWGMTYYPISTLVFVIPLLFMSVVVPGTYSWRPAIWLAWPALGLSFFLMFVSGRRALFVSLAASIFVGFFVLFLRKGQARVRRRLYVVGLVAICGGVLIGVLSRFSLVDMVGSLVADELADDAVRGSTGSALIQSWLQSPVVGQGLGAELQDFVRLDDGNPWAFELQYHLILNSLGLFGFLALAGLTLSLVVVAAAAYARSPGERAYMAPLVVATLAALIANASNPYLHTPGHYWMFFLLVMAANGISRDERNSDAAQEFKVGVA